MNETFKTLSCLISAIFSLIVHFFRKFEKLYIELANAPLTQVVKITNCDQPCNFKEYNFVNTIPKDFTHVEYPEDQMVICLWAVSKYTQSEEEVLVYPFQSFVAEFGGSLGLFLGFSFMTIWDGLKSLAIWALQIKSIPSKSKLLT